MVEPALVLDFVVVAAAFAVPTLGTASAVPRLVLVALVAAAAAVRERLVVRVVAAVAVAVVVAAVAAVAVAVVAVAAVAVVPAALLPCGAVRFVCCPRTSRSVVLLEETALVCFLCLLLLDPWRSALVFLLSWFF